MHHTPVRYLILPGWQGSGRHHWQTHWQHLLPNTRRVQQSDWQFPQRDDWVATLERTIAAEPGPVVLIAHSLGCITVAHWAAQARPALHSKVLGALLVAPADVERNRCPAPLSNFAPIPHQQLGFPSVLVGSSNDRAASQQRSSELGAAWGSHTVILDQAGHINTAAGYTRWEEGFAYLYQLQSAIDKQSRRWA
ncbi:MAG: alpha/beta hydrolase [Pseudomonas sp.]